MVESVQTTAEEINVSNVGLFVVIVAGHLRYCLSMETIEKTSIDQSFEVCFSFRFFFFCSSSIAALLIVESVSPLLEAGFLVRVRLLRFLKPGFTSHCLSARHLQENVKQLCQF
jgi:hypothetical protein